MRLQENGIAIFDNIEVTVKDYRGSIVVEKLSSGKFQAHYEIESLGKHWESGSTFDTLAEAMTEVIQCLKSNVENDFYGE